MASPVVAWTDATVRIRNQWGHRGTGFLIGRPEGPDGQRAFLVTNKHVLHSDSSTRSLATSLDLDINVEHGGNVVGETKHIQIVDGSGTPVWREHSDSEIDVLAVEITGVFTGTVGIRNRLIPIAWLAGPAEIQAQDVTIGEEIMVVGYPIGLRQGATNYPIVRQGIIATRIGETFIEDERQADGTTKQRRIRGFLIDGGTIPGSSGSPVILKPVTSRFVHESINIGPSPDMLLGIIAETRFAPIKVSGGGEIPGFAGLGLAFDAATIQETLARIT